MIRRPRAVDHAILTLNLLPLLTVGVLPFTTALIAEYVKEPHGQHLAAAIYSGSFLLMSVVFATTNRQEGEQLIAVGRELYAWHPERVARSKLWTRPPGRGLGVKATARNWTTTTILLALAD